MRTFIRWLRSLGPLGSAAANVVTFLTTNWVLTMSTIIAIWASLNDWAMAIIHSQRVQTFVEAFLVLVWTIVGLLYLYDRGRPRSVRSVPDYRYGLTFEGISVHIDDKDEGSWLGLVIQLRNFSQAPIRYTVEQFDFRIGSRALPKPKRVLSGYLPRGGGKTICPARFTKDEIKEFFGKRAAGVAELSVTYGHPEEAPLRRLRVNSDIILRFPADGILNESEPLGFGADIVSESDEPIEKIS